MSTGCVRGVTVNFHDSQRTTSADHAYGQFHYP